MSDCLSRAEVAALTVWILSECERLGVTFDQWLDLELWDDEQEET